LPAALMICLSFAFKLAFLMYFQRVISPHAETGGKFFPRQSGLAGHGLVLPPASYLQ